MEDQHPFVAVIRPSVSPTYRLLEIGLGMDIAQFLDFFGFRKSRKPLGHQEWSTEVGDDGGGKTPDRAKFAKALEAIFAEGREMPACQVQVLGLDTVRDRLGERWEPLKERVHGLACRIIAKHLTAADVFARRDELQYLLVFAGLDRETAALKCARIAEEVHRELLGTEGAAELRIQSLVAMVDGKVIFEEKSLDQCIEAVAARVEAPIPGSPGERITIGGNPEQEWRAGPGVPQVEGGVGQESPEDDFRRDSGVNIMRRPDHAEEPPTLPKFPEPNQPGSLVSPEMNLESALPTRELEWDQRNDFVYLPSWDVQRQAITSYHSIPCRKTGSGTIVGDSVFAGEPSPSKLALIDMLSAKYAAETMHDCVAKSCQFLMATSVHYQTFADPNLRSTYTKMCRTIPPELTRYLIVEIVECPRTAPGSRIADVVSMLSPFFRFVMLRASLTEEVFENLRSTGLHSVGADITNERSSEGELFPVLDRFAECAEKIGATSYLHGASSRSLVVAATAAGFSHISGPAIMDPVGMPQHVFRYSWERYYRSPEPNG